MTTADRSALDPQTEHRIRESIGRQTLLSTLGVTVAGLWPGRVELEFKVNLLSPARGDRFRARGEVVRAGRTLTVCSAEVVAWADDGNGEPEASLVRVALMQATMMAVTPPRGG